MRIAEQHSFPGKSIKIRRTNAFSSTEAIGPIIEVVYCDKKYVGFAANRSFSPQNSCARCNRNQLEKAASA
jgi:hypothetical protein